MKLKANVIIGLALISVAVGFAQQPPNLENGFKHWGTYDGGSLDTVNNLNGNQMLHAPLLPSYAQRGGLSVQDFLYMTSKGWQINCTVNQSGNLECRWTSAAQGINLEQTPGLALQRTINRYGSGTGSLAYSAFGYSLTGLDGANHQFAATGGTADSTGESIQFESIDTTGYRLQLSNPDGYGVMNTATITDRHGNQYVAVFPSGGQCGIMGTNHLPAGGGHINGGSIQPLIDDAPMGDQYCPESTLAQQITDSNGNVLTSYASVANGPMNGLPAINTGVSTDTLGRTFSSLLGTPTTDYSGCASSLAISFALLVNYSAPDGTTQPLKFCYAHVVLGTAFNVTGYGESGDVPQQLQLVSVLLPDGTSWSFA